MPERDVPSLPPGATLKRDPALVPLSRDHHHALVHALRLREAAQREAALAPPVARAFLEHWRGEVSAHFADEEDVLAGPAGAVDPSGTARVLEEHAEMRRLVAALEQALAAGSDPRATMRETGELLRDHVRYEERAWFEALQDRLEPAALSTLGTALAGRRAARGAGAGCPLPGER